MATLGSRRDRRATPLVLPLLNDDDATVRQAALQALTLLADPDAVEAIIAAAERQPALVRRQCIDAVKSTDSPLAAAWLFVLSTGHPDEEVQAHARAALAALPTTSSPLTTTN
jgi:HEAT repeat protein